MSATDFRESVLPRFYASAEYGHHLCQGKDWFFVDVDEIDLEDPVFGMMVDAFLVAFSDVMGDPKASQEEIKFLLVRSQHEVCQARLQDDKFYIVMSNKFALRHLRNLHYFIEIEEVCSAFGMKSCNIHWDVGEYFNKDDISSVKLDEEKILLVCDIFVSFLILVINHEMCHIINGHLRYKEALGSDGALAELQQVLEVDADMFAIDNTIRQLSGLSYFKELCGGRQSKFSSIMYILLMSFWLSRNGSQNMSCFQLGLPTSHNYPSNTVRYWSAGNRALSQIIRLDNWDPLEEGGDSLLVFAILKASIRFKISEKLIVSDRLISIMEDKNLYNFFKCSVEHYMCIVALIWADVRSDLSKLRIRSGELAPIDHDLIGRSDKIREAALFHFQNFTKSQED